MGNSLLHRGLLIYILSLESCDSYMMTLPVMCCLFMFIWLSKRSRDGLVNDERYNKLLKGLGDLGVVFLIGCAIGYWRFLMF